MLLLAPLFLAYWMIPEAAWLLMVAVLAVHAMRERAVALWPARAVLACFCALVVVGAHGCVDHPPYDAVKDVWYFSKPVVEIGFGCWAGRRYGARRALSLFLLAAAVVSTDYVLRVAWAWSEYLANDTYQNRTMFGPGSFLCLIAIVLCCDATFRRVLVGDGGVMRWASPVVGGLGLLTILLSRSRTIAVALAAFVVPSVLASSARLRRNLMVGGVAAALLLAASACLGFVNIPQALADAAAGTLTEITPDSYVSDADVNAHWRGFESLLALQEFTDFEGLAPLVGGGFGHMVPLDKVRELGGGAGGMVFDAVPLLHNGYLYILIKTGALGLLLFGGALVALWRALVLRAHVVQGVKTKIVPLWIMALLVTSTGVITGPYNYAELLCVNVFIGVYIATACRDAGGSFPTFLKPKRECVVEAAGSATVNAVV